MAVTMSACGTFQTWPVCLLMSVIRGKADLAAVRVEVRKWTQSGLSLTLKVGLIPSFRQVRIGKHS